MRSLVIRAIALVLILSAVQYVFNADSREQYSYLRGEVDRMEELNAALVADTEQLQLQLQGLRHDDRYLEQVARQEFGMIKTGEVLYRFKETP